MIADLLQPYLGKKTLEQLIYEVRVTGVPVIVSYVNQMGSKNYPLTQESNVKDLCNLGVDGIKLETMIIEDDIFDTINTLELQAEKYELSMIKKDIQRFDEESFEVRDYIIYNAYRITQELGIKAIVCFTENGYTSARMATLNPNVPVITFTKSTNTYRFLNLIW
ncbi:MAG: hypothetical protein LBP53_04375 [Candidatus Peribacteria bacterium]|nr:hypothetical protein [Candidatus Peribacteria bacterium]